MEMRGLAKTFAEVVCVGVGFQIKVRFWDLILRVPYYIGDQKREFGTKKPCIDMSEKFRSCAMASTEPVASHAHLVRLRGPDLNQDN